MDLDNQYFQCVYLTFILFYFILSIFKFIFRLKIEKGESL